MRRTINYKTNSLKLFFFIVFFLCCIIGFSQPVANFGSTTAISGCAPLTVGFQDLSTGNPTAWQWDLGNGTIANQQNPNTVYFNAGSYTVTLKVSNAAGADSITKIQYITVYNKPVVDFSASNTSGCFPLRVNFTDLSTSGGIGTITNWSWDFGDGDTSTLQNPYYKYTIAGNFTITLKVTNSGGCTQISDKKQYIKIPNGVTAKFSNSTPKQCRAPEVINFTNLSSGPPILTYQWNFGNGNTSTLANPTNNYSNSGSYFVQLIATSSSGCIDTAFSKDSIVIRNFQTSFSGPTSICLNTPGIYNNTSSPVNTSSSWNFGDNTSSTLDSPSHQWTTPGIYKVQLINNFGVCIDSATSQVTVIIPPPADFTVSDTFNCKAPLTTQFKDLTVGSTSWSWDFGDGSTSTQQNPFHTYTSPGQYTVTLTANTATGCYSSIISKPNYIKIVEPIYIFNGVPGGGCLPYTFSPTIKASINDPKGIASYLWDFGDGNTSMMQAPTNTYTALGNYTLRLFYTTNDGCSDSIVYVNGIKIGTPPTPNFTAAPLSQCVGKSIQFTDMSIAPVDSWLWNFGDGAISVSQNPLHAYKTSGSFTVTLTAINNGCGSSIVKKNFIQVVPPVAKFTPSFNCTNDNFVTFTDNSISPLTWSWKFGDGGTSLTQNPTHTYGSVGSFNVILTVTNGACSDSTTVPIKVINEHPQFVTQADSICTNTVLQITTTNINKANITNYVYNYGDGYSVGGSSSGPVPHIYTSPGIYSLSVITTDTHGCMDTVSKPNGVYVHGPIAKFTASPLTGCPGLNVTFTDNSTTDGITPITNWQWTYGDGITQNLTNPPYNHIYTAAGNYTAQLKVTDSSGCFDSLISNTPIQVTLPQVSFASIDTLACKGSAVVFSNTSTGLNNSYTWTFGNGLFSTQQNPATSYETDSSYSIKLIATDANGCQDSLVKNNYITVATEKASFTIGDSVSPCIPFEVDFNNTSINSSGQTWDFGDSTSSIVKNPVHYYSIPGIYIATLYTMGYGGCIDSFKHSIQILSANATLTYSPLNGCSPSSTNFHVTTAALARYFWDFGDGNSATSTDSSIKHSYLQPGNYVPKIILTDSTGCQMPLIGSDTIHLSTINVNFAAIDSSACLGSVINFNDSTITSNSTIASWYWNFGDGTNSVQQNPSNTYQAAGIYPVQLVVITSNGCNDSLLKNNYIRINPTPTPAILGDTSSCVPALISFTGISTKTDTSTLSWQWNFGDGNTGTTTNPAAQQYNTPGIFPLQLIVSNLSGCIDTANTTVDIHPLPTTNAGRYQPVCVGTSVQLQASGAYAYVWSAQTPATFLSCTTCPNPVASPTDNIEYYLTGTTFFGCQTQDSTQITIQRKFILTVTPTSDSLCMGQSVQLTANGADNYLWIPTSGLDDSRINIPVAKPDTSITYNVIGYDNYHCFEDTATVYIHVTPMPKVIAGAPKDITQGETVTLTPQYSGDINSWTWTPADGLSCTDCPAPIASPSKSTTYTIAVTNSGGCTATDSVSIFLPCQGSIFIPNTFSPNNDGQNDIFYPRGKDINIIKSMRIFDRLGQTVFQQTDFAPNDATKGWNGTFGGQQASSDTYVYIIEIKCNDNTISTFTGNITLIR